MISRIFPGRPYNSITSTILQKQQQATARKGTVAVDRLTGWAAYTNSVRTDTGGYKYSSNVRSNNLNNLLAETYFDEGFANLGQAYCPFPASAGRNQPSLMYDTGYAYSNLGNGDYYEARSYREYAPARFAQTLTATVKNGSNVHTIRQKGIYNYNANGDLTVAETYLDARPVQTGPIPPEAVISYSYANGRPSQDSVTDVSGVLAVPYERVFYIYDGRSNLATAISMQWGSNGWEGYARNLYTYTPSDKLTINLHQKISPSFSWENSSVDTFTYIGPLLTHIAHYDWDTSTHQWYNGQVTESSFDGWGNPDTVAYYRVTAAGRVPLSRTIYTYTSFQHFDTVSFYAWNGTGYNATPDGVARFYYEVVPTSVHPVAGSRADISLYPNPARDMLNIRFKEQPKGTVHIRIYNTSGQLVQHTTTTGSNTCSLSVNGLPGGGYVAEISDQAGSQRLPFVRY